MLCLRQKNKLLHHLQSTWNANGILLPVQVSYSQAAEKRFEFKTKNIKRWFPSHMSKGLMQMRNRLRQVDLVIEVHDARIPLSGRNSVLRDAFMAKPHILVLNKCDLVKISDKQMKRIYSHYKEEGIEQVLFATCHAEQSGDSTNVSVSQIIPACLELIEKSSRYDREGDAEFNLMVAGIPNVGKSSMINQFRKLYLGRNTATSVGKSPAHTKSMSYKIQVCDNPLVYLFDTPGIFKSQVSDLDEGMKLAVCNTIHDHIVGATMVSEYLLFLLNKNKQYHYVHHFSLPNPTDSINAVLTQIAKNAGKVQTRRIQTGTGPNKLILPNYEYAADKFLSAYRGGELGKFVLDYV